MLRTCACCVRQQCMYSSKTHVAVCHARRVMVICSPLSGFLALWSSHCRAKHRPHGDDSADPYYQNLLYSVARGSHHDLPLLTTGTG